MEESLVSRKVAFMIVSPACDGQGMTNDFFLFSPFLFPLEFYVTYVSMWFKNYENETKN